MSSTQKQLVGWSGAAAAILLAALGGGLTAATITARTTERVEALGTRVTELERGRRQTDDRLSRIETTTEWIRDWLQRKDRLSDERELHRSK